jgi:hypothetical protein
MAWNSLKHKAAPAARNENATGAGRRRSERRPYIIEGWLSRPNNPSDEIEVVALNMSQHGIGFKLPKPLQPGEFFAMEIGLGEQPSCPADPAKAACSTSGRSSVERRREA